MTLSSGARLAPRKIVSSFHIGRISPAFTHTLEGAALIIWRRRSPVPDNPRADGAV